MIFKITPCTCELLDPKIENGGYTRSGDTLLASLRSPRFHGITCISRYMLWWAENLKQKYL